MVTASHQAADMRIGASSIVKVVGRGGAGEGTREGMSSALDLCSLNRGQDTRSPKEERKTKGG